MDAIADADLPVFPFRVNWKGGISERLEWRTEILADLALNEQRQGLRLTPRRAFEVTLTVWDQERAFLELWLHRMAGGEFLFPVWHDSARSSQDAPGLQKTIYLDTRSLEFKIGSYGLLRGFTALSWERFQVAEVHPDRIVTVENLTMDWPRGTRVEPLLRGQMDGQTRTNLASSRASETQAMFETTRAQPYDPGADDLDQYLGLPVLTRQPNRRDGLDVQHEWEFFDSDGGTGRTYRIPQTDRAAAAQKHSWFLRGRTAKADFRSLLYRLQGSLKPVWLPTFNDDLDLAQEAPAGAASIHIKGVGFAYTGGPSSGREHIMIETVGGRLFRKVTGTAAAPIGQERLVLSSPLPAAIRPEDVRRICWMDTARLQNDRIEFNHVNAADGVSKVASIFQTFRNERTAPAILSLPIPNAEMGNGPCGDDVPQCFYIPRFAEFPGWYYKTIIDLPTNAASIINGGSMVHRLESESSSYGATGFEQNSDGEFDPTRGTAQSHVHPGAKKVTSYWTQDFAVLGQVNYMLVQLQGIGGSSDPESRHNTVQLFRWDIEEPIFTANFPGAAGNFPKFYSFTVPTV